MMVFHDFGIDIWISVVSKKKRKKTGKVGEGDDCKMTLARLPGFDYRISSLAISTLHAKRGKEGTIDI